MKRVLTGIKPTGIPHVGNILGAIEPAIDMTRDPGVESFLFIADLHSLTVRPDPDRLRDDVYHVAAAWLACGLDPESAVFYRQSDVPEIVQLAWLIGCGLPLGLLNRAHSFKDAKAKGTDAEDVLFGLYAYPVLMAADILAFDTDVVPVGKDQKQHLEIAQEAARKFNLRYGETLKVPEARIDETVMSVPGIDLEGRKMSKSYDNTLSPFTPKKALEKRIKTMETDSTAFGAPLPVEGDRILTLHRLLASPEATEALTAKYRSGRLDPTQPDGDDPTRNYFGWGHAKKALIEAFEARFGEHRARYDALMADRGALDELLRRGAERARSVASQVLDRALRASGLSPTI